MDSLSGKQSGGSDVEALVLHVLAELAPHPAATPRPETLLVADLGFDSLGLIELVAILEHAFGLEPLHDDKLLGTESIGDLLRLVTGALAADRDGVP
jgi:acyl carrier protein